MFKNALKYEVGCVVISVFGLAITVWVSVADRSLGGDRLSNPIDIFKYFCVDAGQTGTRAADSRRHDADQAIRVAHKRSAGVGLDVKCKRLSFI